MSSPDDSGHFEADLLRRAEHAIEVAEEIRARSEVLVGVSISLRDAGMTPRCAWCGRYRIGEHWVVVEPMPKFLTFVDVTHSICDDCVEALRAGGMSA